MSASWSPWSRTSGCSGLTTLAADSLGLALGTAQGVVKRVNPEVLGQGLLGGDPARPRRPGGRRGRADQHRSVELVFISNDAQLLHFPASASARRAGRAAGWPASSSASAAGWSSSERCRPTDSVVVTVAGTSRALPGTDAGSGQGDPVRRVSRQGSGHRRRPLPPVPQGRGRAAAGLGRSGTRVRRRREWVTGRPAPGRWPKGRVGYAGRAADRRGLLAAVLTRARNRELVRSPVPVPPTSFADLLTRNAGYQTTFSQGGFDGVAHAGVAMLTCMDSRIEPLDMIGLRLGDAKIIRTPGGRLTPGRPGRLRARRTPARREPDHGRPAHPLRHGQRRRRRHRRAGQGGDRRGPVGPEHRRLLRPVRAADRGCRPRCGRTRTSPAGLWSADSSTTSTPAPSRKSSDHRRPCRFPTQRGKPSLCPGCYLGAARGTWVQSSDPHAAWGSL